MRGPRRVRMVASSWSSRRRPSSPDVIRAREASALEIVEAHLARIDALNPTINAVRAARREPRPRRGGDGRSPAGTGTLLGPLPRRPVHVEDNLETAEIVTAVGVVGGPARCRRSMPPSSAGYRRPARSCSGKPNCPDGAADRDQQPALRPAQQPLRRDANAGGQRRRVRARRGQRLATRLGGARAEASGSQPRGQRRHDQTVATLVPLTAWSMIEARRPAQPTHPGRPRSLARSST